MISVNLKATDIDLAVDLFPDAVELVVQNSFRYMGKNNKIMITSSIIH